MGFWSKILGDGSFESTNRLFDKNDYVEYEPPQSTSSRRQQLDSFDSIPVSQQPVIEGVNRTLSYRYAKNDHSTGPNAGTYGLATGERIGPGVKHVDGSLGEIVWDHARDTGEHIWDSYLPEGEVDASIVERYIKHRMGSKWNRKQGNPFVTDAELAPYFNSRGDYVGPRGMKFKIRGHNDQLSYWLEEEHKEYLRSRGRR